MRKRKKWLHKILSFVFAVFSCLLCFVQPFFTAYADESSSVRVVNFDETKIADDFTKTQIDQFSTFTDGETRIVSFMEYCYSPDETFGDNYGLYVYVYNGLKQPLRTNDCSLYLGLTYDEDGTVDEYTQAFLRILDTTDDNVLFKAKIINAKEQFYEKAVQCAETFNGERRYDIKDICLVPEKGDKVTTVINKIYYFTGQASADKDMQSSLVCQAFDKIEITPQFANYRTGIDGDSSNFDGYTCDEINTAYFSVPKEYFDDLGILQKITADWYEYKTAPIFVTNDEYAYAGLIDKIGQTVAFSNGESLYDVEEFPWRVLWEESMDWNNVVNTRTYTFGAHYNGKSSSLNDGFLTPDTYYVGENAYSVPRMDWLFLKSDAVDHAGFAVSKEEIQNYAETYPIKYNQDKLAVPRQDGNYDCFNKNLFVDSIDEDRLHLLSTPFETSGHIRYTFDAGVEHDLKVAQKQSWWEKIIGKKNFDTTGISPIVIFDNIVDFLGAYPNNETGISKFYNENYISQGKDEDNTVYDFCVNSLQSGEYPVLFRFAVTDYYVSNARFDKDDNGGFAYSGMSERDGYVAQETVFLNFDVISLTFRLNGEDTIVSVVMDPVDVWNGVDPNPNQSLGKDTDWDWYMDLLKKIFVIAVFGFIFIFFWPFISPIIGWAIKKVWQLLMFILRLPSKLTKKIFRKKRK